MSYDASDKKYKQKSYDNLNAAYLGFNNQYDLMTVNNYNAQSMANRIKVYAGSYTTDIIIRATSDSSQSQMQAKKIVLTGTANPRSRTNPEAKLAWQSKDFSYTFFQEYTQITFKVGADITLSKGLYWIDWAKVETGQTSTTNATTHYHHPVRTLVEVVGKVANKYSFTTQSLGSNVIKGTSSPALAISTTNSPFADVQISFGLSAGDNANITFEPASVTFGPNDLTKYYSIKVSSDYDISSAAQQIVTFTRSGTDAEVYAMPSSMTFNIGEPATDTTAGLITSWGQGTCTASSCSFAPVVSQVGLILWAITARQQGANDYTNGQCSDISTIDDNAWNGYSTITAAEQANEDKIATDYLDTETDPADGETWSAFQQRKYKEHLQDTYYGKEWIYNSATAGSISATWLWAATDYQICGYVINEYGSISSYSTTGTQYSLNYFATTAMDGNWNWSVTASGTSSMAAINTTTIRDIVSYQQGVNPSRNMITSNTETTSRRLQTTTYSITWSAYLALDRRASTPTTQTIATLGSTETTQIATDLNSKLGTGNSMGTYAQSTYTATQASVSFTTAPALSSESTNSVTISFQSDNDYGEVACVVLNAASQSDYLTNNNLKPTATQVYLGIDRNNAAAVSAKKIDAATTDTSGTTTKATEITLDGLAKGTSYSAFCTATNGYATFPGYVTYASDDNYTPVQFTTDGTAEEDDDDDFASSLGVSLFLMIAALLFN